MMPLVSMVNSARRALAIAREHSGLSQEELGKKLGVSKSVISRYETGNRMLKMPVVDQLLEALHLSPREYCRLIDIVELAEEERVYLTAQQALFPFEVHELAGTVPPPQLPVEKEAEVASRNLMEAVRVLLRCLYRREYIPSE